VNKNKRDTVGKISLQSDFMSVSVLPAAGGNIAAIVDRRSGRNWLWSNPHIPITAPRTGQNYGRDLDSGGWDEILLSIAPDALELPAQRTRQIADHGDLVRQQWSVIDSASSLPHCELRVSGQLLKYDFRRAIELDRDEPQMYVRYALTNHEEFAWPWYWCAHALIDVQPGMQIELPAAQPFRVDHAEDDLNLEERTRRWPDLDLADDITVDLSNSFPSGNADRNFASKIFVESPANGSVLVTAPGKTESLTMLFDRRELPWLGLWINNKGWSGCDSEPHLNLGLEPGTTPYDSVVEAVDHDAIAWLRPGETRNWSLIVKLAA